MPKKKTTKKVAAKKAAPKKKAAATKKAAKKAVKATKPAKKAAAKSKSAPKKKAAKKAAPKKKAAAKPAKTVVSKPKTGPRFPIVGRKVSFIEMEKKSGIKAKKLSKSFLTKQEAKLLELREHIVNQMHGVAQDSLRQKSDSAGSAFGMHQADAGSDAYEKDFALSLLSQEQDALYEVEQAIKRIETGKYGICEMSGEQIPSTRLEAIPYARFTASCQEQMEKEMKSRGRWDSSAQFVNASDNYFEESDNSSDSDASNTKD
jgi:RNA polymerase-binding transcription factor DksA